MIRIAISALIVLISYTSEAQKLSLHKWKNRVIVIQTERPTNLSYQKQLGVFDNLHDELTERKIVVYIIVNNKYTVTNDFRSLDQFTWSSSKDILDKLPRRMRDNRDGFSITLIGLDGGVKLNQTQILRKEELFNIIDSMPMRSAELRRSTLKDKG